MHKHFRFWSFLSVCFLTQLILSHACHAEIRFKRLLMSSGQADNGIGAITGITQDQQGFIWLSGENGVSRFDGVSSQHYIHVSNTPSLNSNYARSIVVDHDGVIWVGTDLGLCYYDPMIDNFRCYKHDPKQANSISDNTVFTILVGPENSLYIGTKNGLNIFDPTRKKFSRFFTQNSDNPIKNIVALMLENAQLWIGTTQNGFSIFDLQQQQLTSYPYRPNNHKSVNFPHVRNFLRQDEQNVWLGTYGGGLNLFHEPTQSFRYYRHKTNQEDSLPSDVVWSSYRDSANNAWFSTDHGGLSRYNKDTDSFTNYYHSPYDHNSLVSNQLRPIFEDHKKNLWIGHFPHGVSYWDRSVQTFKHWFYKPGDNNSISDSAILSFLEDSEGIIWIGTEKGLNAYNPLTEEFTNYLPKVGDPDSLQVAPVLSLAEDSQGIIWVGTWSGGLFHFDKQKNSFNQFQNANNDQSSHLDFFIWKIMEDSNKNIWIATENHGVTLYNPTTKEFKHYEHDANDVNSISSNFVINVVEDSKNRIWIATTNGFDRFDPDTESFVHYADFFDKKLDNDIGTSSKRYRSIYEDKDGRLWIGGQDSGILIFNPRTNDVQKITMAQGLPSNFVSSIIADHQNSLWATTSNGVAKIDPKTLKILDVLTTKSGLVSNNHNRDATLIDAAGNVYLGGINGVTVFNPSDINRDADHYPVVIKDLKILNRSIKPNDLQSPLKQPLSETKHLHLKHQHSMITFEYAALNYQAPLAMQYAYRLKGFDKDWNYVEDKRFATYTNLNHGEYTFEVKARTQGHDWLPNHAQIHLTVQPPPWQTWWAYILYCVVVVSVIIFFVRLHYKKVELNTQKSLNLELIKLNKIKDAFLANTSHELRTPLNGIIGIAESVVEEARTQLNENIRRKLELIVVSGKRLSGLINDILDYTKLGHSELKIQRQAVALFSVVDEALSLLQPLAEDKNIGLRNLVSESEVAIYADENRLLQILINLIGNSIKYSEVGYVSVEASCVEGMLYISVRDTGVGIPESQLNKVFQVFHQAHNPKFARGGTGLGLAVTKELVELHGGKISVTSKPNAGSRFTFSIPVYRANMPAEDTKPKLEKVKKKNSLKKPITKIETNHYTSNSRSLALSAGPENAKDFVILIVDDDAINRMVLSSMLELHQYKIIQAKDGFEALSICETQSVDLIILDVMMPHMDGFEVCQRLRQRQKIYELPIILLTAKKVDEDIVEGFAAGANEFLTKPVSKYDLLPRVANHLNLLQIYRHLSR